jgi:hypothetical protein
MVFRCAAVAWGVLCSCVAAALKGRVVSCDGGCNWSLQQSQLCPVTQAGPLPVVAAVAVDVLACSSRARTLQ